MRSGTRSACVTTVSGSLMEPFYNPAITTPQADDIAGIRSIYGTTAAVAGSVSINDVTITEGNAGTQIATFTVSRTGGTAAFAVNFATANNSALSGSDYVANSGTLSFASGVNTQTISVTINGDKTVEPNETFFVNLSAPTNGATISDGQGQATITNDDTAASSDDFADSLADSTAPFGQAAVGGASTGNLEIAGDRDWFRISLTAGFAVTIDLLGVDTSAGTLVDPYLYLYDSGGNLLRQDDDAGVGFESEINYTPTSTGIYYIGAAAFADSYNGTYRINVSSSSIPADDFRDTFADTTAPFGQSPSMDRAPGAWKTQAIATGSASSSRPA
jgi:Calx-beta domain-containing protein/pre-peptidase